MSSDSAPTLFCSEALHLALTRILITPACPYLADVCNGVSPYWNTEKINKLIFLYDFTHVVLYVGFASIEEENPACFVVPVLAAEVKRGKPTTVLDVEIGLQIHDDHANTQR